MDIYRKPSDVVRQKDGNKSGHIYILKRGKSGV